MLTWIKERENWKGLLNLQVLLITNHLRTFLNVKSWDIQQHIKYFKLFTTWYLNIPLTDFWKKINSVQQLQNEHIWSRTPAKVLIFVTHMENSEKTLNSNFYCNIAKRFVRPKICTIFKFCMDELLQIAANEKLCEVNFHEYQNFISFNFTNKLCLPTWIFDVIYYFEWWEIQFFLIKISWI